MTTTAEATKGVPRMVGDPAPTIRADYNALAEWVLANVGRVETNVAARNAITKKWAGMVVYTAAEKLLWLCTNPAGSGTWLLLTQPLCVLGKSGNQNLTTSAAALAWDTEITDVYAMHDNAVNNTRLIAPVDGVYEVTALVYNNNTAGLGTMYGRKNGTTNIQGSFTRRDGSGTAAIPLGVTFPVVLNATDYVEIMVLHSTAAGTVGGGTGEAGATVTMKRIG